MHTVMLKYYYYSDILNNTGMIVPSTILHICIIIIIIRSISSVSCMVEQLWPKFKKITIIILNKNNIFLLKNTIIFIYYKYS